jgi:hypothetical protein
VNDSVDESEATSAKGGGPFARRKMLRLGGMAAAGAAGAALVTALDASPAAAGVDGDVVLNGDNIGSGSARTAIIANYADNEVFGAFNNADRGTAVRGRAGSDAGHYENIWRHRPVGVFGESGYLGGYGVVGDSADVGVAGIGNFFGGVGVWGSAPNGIGVKGSGSLGPGILGTSDAGVAVIARIDSSTSDSPAVLAETRGHGAAVEATTASAATNPALKSTSGIASQAAVQANGLTANALALDVHGTTVAASGASATAPTLKSTSGSAQPAVQAIGKVVPVSTAVPVAGNAAALNVRGVASFTRSNVATVPAGATSVVVNVQGGLTATSHVLATMQTTTAANVGVKSATPNTATGKITIRLTAAAPTGGISVAWFVFG